MIRGIPISPGIAVARAFRMDPVSLGDRHDLIDTSGLSAEVTRFDQACDDLVKELDETITRVRQSVNEESAAIFQSHRMLVRDQAFVTKVKGYILNDRLNSTVALDRFLQEYDLLFARIPDDYLRERMTDVRDVVEQLIAKLSFQQHCDALDDSEPVVILAREIRPSQAALFGKIPLAGIATETGGRTGHAAVLSRSMAIPAVSGLDGLLERVQTGDTIIVDGREGIVIVNPGTEVEAAYRKLQREYANLRQSVIDNRELESITTDGTRIELLTNVNNVSDAQASVGVGADGVGLFRTEFVFLTHPNVPTEEEQEKAYRNIIELAPNQKAVIRVLDLGGDKQVKYFPFYRQANPFMGWRSIRMSAEHPEFFQTQLRAILRAGYGSKLSILFPFISTIEEVRKMKRLIDRARMALHSQKVKYAEKVEIGVMVEVPAAAICVDAILAEVDYVSIGSNDLVQYLMAADRDNPRVAHLCDPCYPAVWLALRKIIRSCVSQKKPVTLCGEMAGRPIFLLPLIGMGLRHASMSPAFVPTVKAMIRSVSIEDAVKVARKIVKMQTAADIREYLQDRLRKLCPSIANLDTV